MTKKSAHRAELPLGVVLRRTPGVTRWARWYWRAIAILPGAAPAQWAELRRDGESVEYHAATLPLTLYSSDTEAYAVNLADAVPSVYVVVRKEPDGPAPLRAFAVTASVYEAQDYCDSGEELVEKVPMPEGLLAWVGDFVDQHHEEEVFVKRRRRNWTPEQKQDGIGDMRIRQDADVFRVPQRGAR